MKTSLRRQHDPLRSVSPSYIARPRAVFSRTNARDSPPGNKEIRSRRLRRRSPVRRPYTLLPVPSAVAPRTFAPEPAVCRPTDRPTVRPSADRPSDTRTSSAISFTVDPATFFDRFPSSDTRHRTDTRAFAAAAAGSTAIPPRPVPIPSSRRSARGPRARRPRRPDAIVRAWLPREFADAGSASARRTDRSTSSPTRVRQHRERLGTRTPTSAYRFRAV